MVDITKPVYGTVWAESGEKLAPIEAKMQSGWVQEMMPYQYENFLQNRQDIALTYLFQKGVAEWSSEQEYIANKSIVSYLSNLYVSTATSTNVVPTDTGSWRRLTVTFDVNGTIPVASGGTGATSAADARTNLGLGTAATLAADTIVLKAVSGGAPYADRWTNPMSFTITGGASGNTSFDGSSATTLNLTSVNAATLTGPVPIPSLTNAVVKTSSTGSAILPSGTTAQRDLSPLEGYTRWNTTNKTRETFNGTVWTVDTAQNEAYVLNRANHTGVQAISTITGLQTALDSTVKKTDATGVALLPEGNSSQRPLAGAIPTSVFVVRGNTQDPADYIGEYWDRVASAWRTFASRTWVTAKIQELIDAATGFTVLYPNGGSSASPANVSSASRYVMANPFSGRSVICEAQLRSPSGNWGSTGWQTNVSTGAGVGTRAAQFDDSIIVQTGGGGIASVSPNTGGSFDSSWPTGFVTSAPCRVIVWKVKG